MSTPTECPKCGSLRTDCGKPFFRLFYACDSYLYSRDIKLSYQSTLCEAREEVKELREKLSILESQYAAQVVTTQIAFAEADLRGDVDARDPAMWLRLTAAKITTNQ